MRRPLVALLFTSAALPGGALLGPRPTALATAPPPSLAVLATRPGAGESTVHLVALDDRRLPPPQATLTHLAGAVLRGAALPGGQRLLVVVDVAPRRDLSFAAALLAVDRGAVSQLADGLVHASRPVVTTDGRVLVERGAPGPAPTVEEIRAGRLRLDELTVEEVGIDGRRRPIYRGLGYTAHLAATFAEEAILYRVGPDGADLTAVHLDNGRQRLLAALPPFARDFSVDDQGGLIFAGRRDGAWTVERLDLRRGERTTIAWSFGGELAPSAVPGGIVYNPDGGPGLTALRGRLPVRPPLGPGVDQIKVRSDDGAWLAGLHFGDPDQIPPLFLLDRHGRATTVAAPVGVRLEPIGFVDGGRR